MFNLKYKLMDEAGGDGGEGGGSHQLSNDDGGGAGKWADGWRDQFVESMGELDDEGKAKELEIVGRFQSPGDVYKSMREAQIKISQGGNSAPVLPDNPTDDDIKAYREALGVPQKHDAYFEGLGDDAIAEADKGMFEDFFEHVLHKNHLPASVAADAASWWKDMQQSMEEVRGEADNEIKAQTEDHLRGEWGRDYRTNVGILNNFVAKLPESIREGFQNARLPDGTPIMYHPDLVKALVGIENEINPASHITPAGGDPGANVEERIAEIQKQMKTNRHAYNKDEKMQAEYRDLLTLRDKLAQK